jgi:hypothetical protein
MRILDGPKLLAAAVAICYGLFLFWYGGKTAPLDRAEVDALVAVIEQNLGAAGGGDPELIRSFRRVGAADDGREFFMVNLIRQRQKALYPDGYDHDDDVQAAARRYAAGILPRLLKRSAFPVFIGRPTGLFLQPEGAEEWDQVAIVRYRSRRDFLEMVAEPGMSDVGLHKRASVEKTQVFPADPIVSFIWIRTAVAVVFALLGGTLHIALRRFTWYRSTR